MREDLNKIENISKEAIRGMVPDSSVMPSDRTRTQEVPPQHEQELLCTEGGRALNRLPRDVMESLPLGRHSKLTWTHSCVTCSWGPCNGRVIGLTYLQGFLPTLSIL